jgi:membrane protease YdiL (CAAX protease family)
MNLSRTLTPLPALSVPHRTAASPFARLTAWPLAVAALAMSVAVMVLPQPLAVLLVLAPLIEELLFRAGLQEALLRRGLRPLVANLAATLAFALLHGLTRSWPLALAVLLPSFVLGRVYQGRRRIAPVVALHALMNLCWVALASSVTWLFPLFP